MNKFYRKVSSIKYLNTSLPESYESTENSYKNIRDNFSELKGTIVFLKSFEYGNMLRNSLVDTKNYISTKTNISKAEKISVFDQLKTISENIKTNASNENLINSSEQSAQNFSRLVEQKKKFNEKLEGLIEMVDLTKKKMKEIDVLRENVRETRFYLEKSIQSNKEENKLGELKEKFNSQTNEALGKMKNVIFDDGFENISKEFSKILKEYFEESANSIKI